MVARRDDKVKLAGYFINFTETCVHIYNEVSGCKGDFMPSRFDIEKRTVSICDNSKHLPIKGESISVDELVDALSGTKVYCIFEDGETAEKLLGKELEQAAIVVDQPVGHNNERVAYLRWAVDDSLHVVFSSNEICP